MPPKVHAPKKTARGARSSRVFIFENPGSRPSRRGGRGEGWESGTRLREAELMQYRSPVGLGPSLKTCPRWESHRAHRTSVRRMKWEVSLSSRTASGGSGWKKDGQPVPESNLLREEKSGASQQTHWYCPEILQSWYFPVKARSVPLRRVTLNCSSVSRARSSSSAGGGAACESGGGAGGGFCIRD